MVDHGTFGGGITQRLGGVRLVAACVAVFGAAASATAAPVEVNFVQDPVLESGFVLDFGFPGGVSSAEVSNTVFDLQIDPAAGTARFLNYSQSVDPLLLQGPNGPVSTGDITVEIVASLGGVYDRATGQFVTNDIYAVHFTGDLSIFGIESPFILPSSSSATIQFVDFSSGNTALHWNGGSQLAGFDFTYTCTVRGTFDSTNTTAFVAASTPAHNTVDARQPHDLFDASATQGTQSIDIRFNSPTVQQIGAADLIVTEWGDDATGPTIESVQPLAGDTIRLELSSPIAPGAWTVVTHIASGTSVCLGSLPGDVNADRVVAPSDILETIDCINGVTAHHCALSHVDVDRSGEAGPSDILRVIDLLNGAGEFDTWLNATLGPSPCAN